jgi:hypothetical protein
MNKSGTSAFFGHVLLLITFLKHFLQFFLTDLKSAWNLVEMLFAHISTLSKIVEQMRSKWVKKQKKR